MAQQTSAAAHYATCATRHGGDCTCEYIGARAYRVVRFYFNRPGRPRTIIPRCTLAEAQAHCSDPETSSTTARGSAARARTRRMGPWFDGYDAR